jgi:hypothetical protein
MARIYMCVWCMACGNLIEDPVYDRTITIRCLCVSCHISIANSNDDKRDMDDSAVGQCIYLCDHVVFFPVQSVCGSKIWFRSTCITCTVATMHQPGNAVIVRWNEMLSQWMMMMMKWYGTTLVCNTLENDTLPCQHNIYEYDKGSDI